MSQTLECISDILKFLPCPEDCGKCCEIPVSLRDNEVKQFKGSIKKVRFELMGRTIFKPYLRKRSDGFCVFYNKQDKKCNIYKRKPEICSTFPFIIDAEFITLIVRSYCPVSLKLKDILYKFTFKVNSSGYQKSINTMEKVLEKGIKESNLQGKKYSNISGEQMSVFYPALELLLLKLIKKQKYGGMK